MTSRKVQQKRAKRARVSRSKRKLRNIGLDQLSQQVSALKNFRKVEVNNQTDLNQFIEHLDPNEYGKTWGLNDANPELKEKMDKIVADELNRQKDEQRVARKIDPDQVSDTGNLEFGESTVKTETEPEEKSGNFNFGQ
jgi:cobalamin-dependent methionine synthase I